MHLLLSEEGAFSLMKSFPTSTQSKMTLKSTEQHSKAIHLYTHEELESITPIKEDKIPTVMTVAGSDSSGGAGIEADIKTITAHKCYGLTSIVTLTAQNTTGVKNVAETSAEMVRSILDENFSDIKIDSIKTGLLTDNAIIALKESIQKYNYVGNLVVDPVMVSTSGFDFVSNKFLDVLISNLAPYTTLITPNLIEAKTLVNTLSGHQKYDEKPLSHIHDMHALAKEVHELSGIKNVLVKGGHQKWSHNENLLTDLLYLAESDEYIVFHSHMQKSTNTHGTGCTLSSAIASNLAAGLSMINSIANAIVYVQKGIENAPNIGNGHGPLNHIQTFQQFNYEYLIDDGKFKLPFTKGNALDYLINHPEIKQLWVEYTNHKFMKSVKNYDIPFDSFVNFLKQDIVYLTSYAHVALYMATKVTNENEFLLEADSLKTISKEISKYKVMLHKLGFNESQIKQFKASKVCQDYIDGLLDIAKESGDIFDISVSIAPCFHGYYTATVNAINATRKLNSTAKDELQRSLYDGWIADHSSEWYKNGCVEANTRLNDIFEKHCKSEVKVERAIHIFKKFTQQEIKFLNSFL